MMVQYRRIKQQYRDEVLFFRMGDFYEMFEQDAAEVSSLLDLTLTQRAGVPMCGIPYHAAQGYIGRLLKAGKKVAICEQTHIPKPGRGLATREVVEVVTPGTVVDESYLDRCSNNYLAAIGRSRAAIAFAYVDLSTAEFAATSFPPEERIDRLRQELFSRSPREIIVQESLLEEDQGIRDLLLERDRVVLNRLPDWSFDIESSRKALEKQLGVSNLKGFGLDEQSPEIAAAGVILEYVLTASKSIIPHLKDLAVYRSNTFVGLDESTQRNLELLRNLHDGSRRYTLLEILDHCKTSMGARKLRRWIVSPLIEAEAIRSRLDQVEFFYRNQILLSNLREELARIPDLERLASKVAMDRAHAKNLLSVKHALTGMRSLLEITEGYAEMASFAGGLRSMAKDASDMEQLLERSIAEEPSILLSEGNLIKDGYHDELDRLRKTKKSSRSLLHELLEEERKKTGISSLKLRFNRIIGYFFEVTKPNLRLVPPHFIRRQSLVGSERFTTERLTSLESDISNATEDIIALERRLFLEIREQVKANVSLFMRLAAMVSEIDVLESFAFAATVRGYSRPQPAASREIDITAGRHPVVEANLPSGAFVPNDVHIGSRTGTFILLTGPNMAGKSTYLRQAALIVLMAQIGSFVPAQEARIGLVDQIFCRVGATDNLARGESTFLVEMNETANILRSAGDRSLLVLDEVGRGTGTNDGLAIAWAVTEYIIDKVHARTLFATHYHELTSLRRESLLNLCMDVLERDGEIVFLKKVKPGSSDNSYGIHVAKLAGLPEAVTDSASRILEGLADRVHTRASVETKPEAADRRREPPRQQSLFSPAELLVEEIRGVNVENLTPLEALNLLARLRERATGLNP